MGGERVGQRGISRGDARKGVPCGVIVPGEPQGKNFDETLAGRMGDWGNAPGMKTAGGEGWVRGNLGDIDPESKKKGIDIRSNASLPKSAYLYIEGGFQGPERLRIIQDEGLSDSFPVPTIRGSLYVTSQKNWCVRKPSQSFCQRCLDGKGGKTRIFRGERPIGRKKGFDVKRGKKKGSA